MSPYKHLSSVITATSLSLCLAGQLSCTGAEIEEEALLRDAVAARAGKDALTWMKSRVDLMVRHKANCAVMAEQLLEDDKRTEEQRRAWREARAQEWLIAKSAGDFEFQKELSELITRGDLVFSFCAFFEDFRDRLKL